jgi:hypothetical protein
MVAAYGEVAARIASEWHLGMPFGDRRQTASSNQRCPKGFDRSYRKRMAVASKQVLVNAPTSVVKAMAYPSFTGG